MADISILKKKYFIAYGIYLLVFFFGALTNILRPDGFAAPIAAIGDAAAALAVWRGSRLFKRIRRRPWELISVGLVFHALGDLSLLTSPLSSRTFDALGAGVVYSPPFFISGRASW